MGKTFLNFQQRTELEEHKDYLEKQLKNPLVQDVPMVRRNLRRVEQDLADQAPPELRGPSLDKVVRREKELREEIVPNMQSQAVMRMAPAGSVGREIDFQKRYKSKIIEWKNCVRTIHRESEDPDIANLERYRPVGGATQLNLDNALIPGKQFDFPSPAYQAGYENIEWKDGYDQSFESEASKARRAKLAELRAQMEALEAEEAEESEPPPSAEEAPSRLGLEED